MTIEIVDFPSNELVDLSIVMLVITGKYRTCLESGEFGGMSKVLLKNRHLPKRIGSLW